MLVLLLLLLSFVRLKPQCQGAGSNIYLGIAFCLNILVFEYARTMSALKFAIHLVAISLYFNFDSSKIKPTLISWSY